MSYIKSSLFYLVICGSGPEIRRLSRARGRTLRSVQVVSRKLVEERCSYWEAVRGKRTVVPGTAMALGRGDLPHDLTQLVVEAAVGVRYGFWGCVAAGATFKSTGRKRTKPGRAVIAQHREDLRRAEHVTGEHVARWKAGHDTPVARQLDRMAAFWEGLDEHDELVIEWPSLRTETRAAVRV